MKKLTLIIMVFMLTAGIAYARNYEVKKKAGAYDVTVMIDRNPPIVGDNNVTIEIRDAAGTAVTDAKVKVDYSMPAMPGMPAMNYKENASLNGTSYRAIISPAMAGSWNVEVKITRGGKTARMKFSIDAR